MSAFQWTPRIEPRSIADLPVQISIPPYAGGDKAPSPFQPFLSPHHSLLSFKLTLFLIPTYLLIVTHLFMAKPMLVTLGHSPSTSRHWYNRTPQRNIAPPRPINALPRTGLDPVQDPGPSLWVGAQLWARVCEDDDDNATVFVRNPKKRRLASPPPDERPSKRTKFDVEALDWEEVEKYLKPQMSPELVVDLYGSLPEHGAPWSTANDREYFIQPLPLDDEFLMDTEFSMDIFHEPLPAVLPNPVVSRVRSLAYDDMGPGCCSAPKDVVAVQLKASARPRHSSPLHQSWTEEEGPTTLDQPLLELFAFDAQETQDLRSSFPFDVPIEWGPDMSEWMATSVPDVELRWQSLAREIGL